MTHLHDQHHDIKTLLEKELARTEQRVDEYRELTRPVGPENAIGRVSRMDAINNKSVTEAALRQAEEKLERLRHMQSRLDDPDFGYCTRCKKPIPAGRLMAMPQSSYCVQCAG
ncbi:MAG: TraR/DksA family transcriptional regulator [Bacteroidota bacterium]